MKFVSTRDKTSQVTGSEAIIKGISPEGGLFVPEDFPNLGNLKDLTNLDYRELAAHILNLYFDELGEEKLLEIARSAYDSKFPEEVVPMKKAGGVFLELYHGKTHAFKDMALSILPYLLKASLEANGNTNKVLILVATSGDTGKAALEGFKDVDGVRAIVFYPEGKVSEIQRLQMVTQKGENLEVLAIEGNFDDAQTGVKKAFTDQEYKKDLLDLGYELSSANSINIGRLVPQIIYYVNAYLRLAEAGDISLGDGINVCVPTGNFGNILAAYYAKRMGLPINKLLVASNDNNVLTGFFNTGEYDSNRDLLLTSSPSMDILISSNLERFLYHLAGDDDTKVREAMKALDKDKLYQWEDLDKDLVYAGYADEDEVSEAIRDAFEKYSYVIDPHTAAAYSVYKDYKEESGDETLTLIASTASPYKFPGKVLSSLGRDIPKDEFDRLDDLAKLIGKPVPENLAQLKTDEVLHMRKINPSDMNQVVKEIIGGRDV